MKPASAVYLFFIPCGYPLDLLFVELAGFCSNVVCIWPFGAPIPDLLVGSLLRVNVSHCPCQAFSNLTEIWQGEPQAAWWVGPP